MLAERLTLQNTLPINLEGQKWEKHFKTLFTKVEGDIDSTKHKINTPIYQALNEKFNLDELKNKKIKKQLAQTVLQMNF